MHNEDDEFMLHCGTSGRAAAEKRSQLRLRAQNRSQLPIRNAGHEMKPPFKVEIWKSVDENPRLLAVTESFEAARQRQQAKLTS